MSHSSNSPPAFLEVLVKKLDLEPALEALDAGYETGEWRAAAFAAHLIEWLPEFALTPKEYENISGPNSVRLIIEAARRVYTTDKYEARGEYRKERRIHWGNYRRD